MELVTSKENSRRGNTGKNNQNIRKTHCIRNHQFTENNTYLYKNSRKCRICHREYKKNWKKLHKSLSKTIKSRKSKPKLYLSKKQFTNMGRFERMYGGRDARKEWRNAHKSETSAYNSAYYKQNYDTKIKPRRDVQRVSNRKNPILGF